VAAGVNAGAPPLDTAAIKAQFPLLRRHENGHPIVYLDSAATSQKPQSVLDAMDRYYAHHNANVHRGAYVLAEEATAAMETARDKVARFVGAASTREVIFTRNATEAINLVARSWGHANLRPGDAVVLSLLEHHSNIVPWHQLAAERGVELRWLPITGDAQLDLATLDVMLDGAKLLTVTAASNVAGTLPPLDRLVAAAKAAGAATLIDACQYVPHHPTDVAALGADFLAFSGHKMCGPTGIGVLWGREAMLEAMPPFLGGGEMILDVTVEGFTTRDLPHKFEAGTPAIAEAVGLGAAVDFLSGLGMEAVRAHSQALSAYALRTLKDRYGADIDIVGPVEPGMRTGLVAFHYRDIHPHDLSQVLDQSGVCVRAGHHCAKPLHHHLGAGATARASWYVYNDEADIDALVEALGTADDVFGF
jgi:cysteine desulfurase/selenocysteine lyase